MDIDERQSDASPERWKAFHISTLVVCALGVLANVSSLIVIKRHLTEIAGSLLLLALAVADLGVASVVAFCTLSYVTYGNNQLTQVLYWWFRYCYYCSIYVTTILPLDRYLHTAKSMLLRKINYKKILKRVILAVFAVMLVISLPHLLGTCVRYFFGPHLVKIKACTTFLRNDTYWGYQKMGNLSSSQWEISICGDTQSLGQNVSYSELDEYKLFVDTMRKEFPRGTGCNWQLVSVPSDKFRGLYLAEIDYDAHYELNSIHVCRLDMRPMRYDPDFVKALYLGIDLSLLFAIPLLVLVVLNVCLVVAVRKGNQRHSEITQTETKSVCNLPVLRSAFGSVCMFLGCRTGWIGLFTLDVFRVFEDTNRNGLRTSVNVFLHKDRATTGLAMKGSAFLLIAVNSIGNTLLYCFSLPTFREKWVSLFFPFDWKQRLTSGRDVQDMIPMEEVRKESICLNIRISTLS